MSSSSVCLGLAGWAHLSQVTSRGRRSIYTASLCSLGRPPGRHEREAVPTPPPGFLRAVCKVLKRNHLRDKRNLQGKKRD